MGSSDMAGTLTAFVCVINWMFSGSMKYELSSGCYFVRILVNL